ASYAPICTEEDRQLAWERTATQLHHQVRGWGRQGAWAEIEGARWLVRRARPVATTDATARPGTPLPPTPEGPLIQTGEGALLLLDAEPAPSI
ncbi:MAG: methionyl-tRNA formyltransferase, partial [Ktedonobacterales bacterium]|nr:methionyl-tRNA formyltransferase [Ktedonobacterales bacterium]